MILTLSCVRGADAPACTGKDETGSSLVTRHFPRPGGVLACDVPPPPGAAQLKGNP